MLAVRQAEVIEDTQRKVPLMVPETPLLLERVNGAVVGRRRAVEKIHGAVGPSLAGEPL